SASPIRKVSSGLLASSRFHSHSFIAGPLISGAFHATHREASEIVPRAKLRFVPEFSGRVRRHGASLVFRLRSKSEFVKPGSRRSRWHRTDRPRFRERFLDSHTK